jgi:hypothetical protein
MKVRFSVPAAILEADLDVKCLEDAKKIIMGSLDGVPLKIHMYSTNDTTEIWEVRDIFDEIIEGIKALPKKRKKTRRVRCKWCECLRAKKKCKCCNLPYNLK